MIPTLCELWELSYSSLTTAISLEVSFAQPIMSSPNTCKDWSLAKDIKNPYASFKRSSFAELCYFNSSSFCLPNSKFILFTSGRLLGSVWILWPPSPVLQSRNCPQCTQGESCGYFWSSFSTQPPPLANSKYLFIPKLILLNSVKLSATQSKKCLQSENQNNYKTYFTYFPSLGITVLHWLLSKFYISRCYVYFLQFSSCLWQEGWIQSSLVYHCQRQKSCLLLNFQL